MRAIERRRVVGWKAKLAVVLACAAVAACGDDDGGGPVPTVTPGGQATATRTRTSAAAATNTPTSGSQTPASTPTATQTPDGTSPTNTPGNGGPLTGQAAVEAFVSGVVGGFADIAAIAGGGSSSQLAGFPSGAQLPPINLPPVTTDCGISGTRTFSCTSGANAQIDLTFVNCREAVEGVESFLDGTFELSVPGTCLTAFPIPAGTTFTATIDAAVESIAEGKTTAADFDIVESITLGADASVEFSVDGTATTDCVGTVSIETLEPVFIPAEADCSTEGALRVGLSDGPSIVRFLAGGATEIDLGADDDVDASYPSCEDESLEQCE